MNTMGMKIYMLLKLLRYLFWGVLYENVFATKLITSVSYIFGENTVILLPITITCNFETLPLTHGAKLFEF